MIRLRSFLRLSVLGLTLGALSLGGCAMFDRTAPKPSNVQADGSYSAAPVRVTLSDALTAVNKIYADPVPVGPLAVLGLKGLQTIEPRLDVVQAGKTLTLRLESSDVVSYDQPGPSDSSAWAALIGNAIERLRPQSEPLRKADDDDVIKALMTGISGGLDRVSHYETPDQTRDNRAHREGFGGIGVRIEETDPVMIRNVVDDTPAARAGLQVGDRIVTVDGAPTAGLTLRRMVNLLRGEESSSVVLGILRGVNSSPFSIKLRRERILDQTVNYRREANDIGYLRVTDYATYTADQVKRAFERGMTESKRPLKGLVLDLRDNPGGILDQGVAVAELFVRNGLLLSTRGRAPNSSKNYSAESDDITHGLPMVVLVNGRTASAAEITTAALQDLGRAVVVGSSSYGKGTVQAVHDLPNEGSFVLTWAKFYSPSNYNLDKLGVFPTICTNDGAPDGVSNPADRVQDLKSGKIDPIRLIAQRRTADKLDEAQKAEIKATCPPFTGKREADTDLDIALKLLSDPPLVARSLRGLAINAGAATN